MKRPEGEAYRRCCPSTTSRRGSRAQQSRSRRCSWTQQPPRNRHEVTWRPEPRRGGGPNRRASAAESGREGFRRWEHGGPTRRRGLRRRPRGRTSA
eukprot:2775030-Rhodomonas_salina.4